MVRLKTRYAALFLSVSLTVAVLAARSREQQRPALNMPAFGNIKTDSPEQDDSRDKSPVPVFIDLRPIPHPTPIEPSDWVNLPAKQSHIITIKPQAGSQPTTIKLQAFSLKMMLKPVQGQAPQVSAELVPAENMVSLSQKTVRMTDKSQSVTIRSLQKSSGAHVIFVVASGSDAKQEFQGTAAFLLNN